MKNSLILILLVIYSGFLLGINLNKPLPIDSTVKIGKLKNGLTYYIKKNNMPENRAELRLVVNAGSILEDDDQQGLAHFCEHMAFNGTKNFEKSALTDYLASIGMGFAGGLNAYTSFDETVYMLKSPTDNQEKLKKAVFILSEWAHNLSFDNEEIDKERGVIIEEWRGGRGANERMMSQNRKVILQGSKYAQRNPIGQYEILSTFSYDKIKKFYKDWYRPDLQAVVVVGDFDIPVIEKYINTYFGEIKVNKNAKPRVIEPVPDHEETLVTIATDKEANYNSVSIYYKGEIQKIKTIGDYRKRLLNELFNDMFSDRLNELAQKENPPFIYAGVANYPMARSKSSFMIYANVPDNKILTGLKQIVIEKERILRFGFTSSELERSKLNTLKGYERQFKEQNKLDSGRITRTYIRNFLTNNPMMSPEQEYQLINELLPDISLTEINQVIKNYLTENNRVIAVSMPDKDSLIVPTKEDLLNILNETEKSDVTAYVDKVSSKPLLKVEPIKGSIVSKKFEKIANSYELILSNGVRVIYKKTDFKNDQIIFDAYSPGGYSLSTLEKLPSASMSSTIINSSGLGEYDNVELAKFYTGHLIRINSHIDSNSESIKGSFGTDDLDLAMQVIYANFVYPRKDPQSFSIQKNRLKEMLKYKNSNPLNVLEDSLQIILFNDNPWLVKNDEKSINALNLDDSYNFYKERFSNAGDFTFYFVGAIEPTTFEPLLEKYIASLPSNQVTDPIIDHQINYQKGLKDVKIYAGEEEKSEVRMIIANDFANTKESSVKLRAMLFIFNELLRETIREKLSGVYGVYSYPVIETVPQSRLAVYITLGCSPNRVDELSTAIYQIIDQLQNQLVEDKYMNVFLQTNNVSFDTNIKKNDYWLNNLKYYDMNKMNISDFINHKEFLKKVTKQDIQKYAKDFLNYKTNLTRVSLYPKKK